METEQTLRAELLAQRGALHIANEEGLNPQSLAAKVDEALNGLPSDSAIDVNGGQKSAALLTQWLEERP